MAQLQRQQAERDLDDMRQFVPGHIKFAGAQQAQRVGMQAMGAMTTTTYAKANHIG